MNEEERVQQLIDDIGSFIEYWGFRKIQGRIWGLLYLSNRPLSTPEIVEKLGVSKALISGGINELLNYRLVERSGQVKFGGITYITTPSPAKVVREIIENRELVLFEQIQNNLSELNRLNTKSCDELGINSDSLKNLKTLTGCHKTIARKLSKKNIVTMKDWIQFMKKVARFGV